MLELLYLDLTFEGVTFRKEGQGIRFQMHLGTQQTVFLKWNDTRVFLTFNRLTGGLAAAAGSTLLIEHQGFPFRYQFQTVDGFGYLLASDSFRINMLTENLTPSLVEVDWKLYYRFVDIPLAEFIGIVQSTQAT